MILYLYLMNTVYFNLRAEYHEKIRTPPADAIKDCLRVPGTFLFHNKNGLHNAAALMEVRKFQ